MRTCRKRLGPATSKSKAHPRTHERRISIPFPTASACVCSACCVRQKWRRLWLRKERCCRCTGRSFARPASSPTTTSESTPSVAPSTASAGTGILSSLPPSPPPTPTARPSSKSPNGRPSSTHSTPPTSRASWRPPFINSPPPPADGILIVG